MSKSKGNVIDPLDIMANTGQMLSALLWRPWRPWDGISSSLRNVSRAIKISSISSGMRRDSFS